MFERDYDETKIWINEKLKAASDYEGYLVRICTVLPCDFLHIDTT